MSVTTTTLTSADQVKLSGALSGIGRRLMERSLGGANRDTTFTITSNTTGAVVITYTDGNGTITESVTGSVAVV